MTPMTASICHKTLAECGASCTCCGERKENQMTKAKSFSILVRFYGNGHYRPVNSTAFPAGSDYADARRYGLLRPPGVYRVTFTLALTGKYIVKSGAGIPDIRLYTERRDTSHFVNVCLLPSSFVGKRVDITIRKMKED